VTPNISKTGAENFFAVRRPPRVSTKPPGRVDHFLRGLGVRPPNLISFPSFVTINGSSEFSINLLFVRESDPLKVLKISEISDDRFSRKLFSNFGVVALV